jgi:DNA-binding NarL/FixJ family response regulator
VTRYAWQELSNRLHLSPRETLILQGFFNDWTEDCIAVELNSSANTVHTHVKRLYRKLVRLRQVNVYPACEA